MLPIQVDETCPYPLYMVKSLGKQHGLKMISIHIFVNGLSSVTKKERLKALVWFWLINETLGANPFTLSDDEIG